MEDMTLTGRLGVGDHVVFTCSRRLYCRDDSSTIYLESGETAEVVKNNRYTIDIRFDDGRIAYGCSTESMKLLRVVSSNPDTRVWATRQ
jgi:hypothetical protein